MTQIRICKKYWHRALRLARAAKDAKALFGKAPKAYAYDRAGWSEANGCSVARFATTGMRRDSRSGATSTIESRHIPK